MTIDDDIIYRKRPNSKSAVLLRTHRRPPTVDRRPPTGTMRTLLASRCTHQPARRHLPASLTSRWQYASSLADGARRRPDANGGAFDATARHGELDDGASTSAAAARTHQLMMPTAVSAALADARPSGAPSRKKKRPLTSPAFFSQKVGAASFRRRSAPHTIRIGARHPRACAASLFPRAEHTTHNQDRRSPCGACARGRVSAFKDRRSPSSCPLSERAARRETVL